MPLTAMSPDLVSMAQPVAERVIPRSAEAVKEISSSKVPLILRGFVSDWPMVEAARQSGDAAIKYLKQFDTGAVVPVSAGPASLKGRLFYNDDYTGLNTDRGNANFGTLLDRVLAHGQDPEGPVIYMASMALDECVPGFDQSNAIDFGAFTPVASIWIGTRTRIAAHNDLPLNIACVAAGRRRFTLFPPDQIENLYVGPFELTPAGRPISLVDFHDPDLEQFPRFRHAMETALIAELEPGDALFIPSMWWHHVEALSAVNVLVNYWWRTVPLHLGTPQDVLMHAMMTLRDLPPEEKQVWREHFDHYVFGDTSERFDHVPRHVRGILNPIDETMTKRVRTFLRQRLDR